MKKRTTRCASLAFVLAAMPALAQGSPWIVGPTGTPGADFSTITAAVAAARAGDTILVRSGVYSERAPLTISKPLALLADPGATLRGVGVFDTICVRGLAAHESCTIRGLRVIAEALIEVTGRVFVEDCAGLVLLSELEGLPRSTSVPGGAAAAVVIEDCDQFHVHDVSGGASLMRIERSRGVFSSQFGRGTRYIIEDSDVTFDRCDVSSEGASIPFSFFPPLTLTRSTVSASRSMFRAGVASGFGVTAQDSILRLDPSTAVSLPTPFGTNSSVVRAPLTTLSTVIRAGVDLEFDLQGEAGDNFAVLLAFPGAVGATPLGDLWVHPDLHLVVGSGLLATRDRVLTVPLVAGIPSGLILVAQGMTLGGAFRLSNGVGVTTP